MNKIVHFDMPVEDVERAKKFYQDVFGWKMNPVPGMNYTIIHTVETDENQMPKETGAINGGMYKKDTPEDITVIVADVPDIDAHIKKAEESGGKLVMPKTEIPGMGFYARIKDTENNIVGIFQVIKKE
jgi:uncharacterized protein